MTVGEERVLFAGLDANERERRAAAFFPAFFCERFAFLERGDASVGDEGLLPSPWGRACGERRG
jgi:hypothetical protein